MLNTLQFKLTLPTPYVFLTRYLKARSLLSVDCEHATFVF